MVDKPLRIPDGIGHAPIYYQDMVGEGTKDDPGQQVVSIKVNEDAGALDVKVQDQFTDTVILPLVRTLNSDTLAVAGVKNTRVITVTDGTKFTVGNHIRIFAPVSNRYMWATVTVKNVNVITLDNLLDYDYPLGAQVTINSTNLAVNGSVTPVHFHLRTGAPSIPSKIDITRMIIVCQTAGSVDLNKFGDLPALTNGLLFRKENGATGEQRNILNAKSNADLAGLAYDWEPYSASNPAQGVDGFKWRLTFASQGKIGVVLRIDQFGQLGMIVQDNLSGLVSLNVMVEGHVVD